MGRLLIKKQTGYKRAADVKSLSKGERLGWTHVTTSAPITLVQFASQGQKLNTYTSGPFSANKLVP